MRAHPAPPSRASCSCAAMLFWRASESEARPSAPAPPENGKPLDSTVVRPAKASVQHRELVHAVRRGDAAAAVAAVADVAPSEQAVREGQDIDMRGNGSIGTGAIEEPASPEWITSSNGGERSRARRDRCRALHSARSAGASARADAVFGTRCATHASCRAGRCTRLSKNSRLADTCVRLA